MLDLGSSRWRELTHAYGNAADIPKLLEQAAKWPSVEKYEDEPYYSLWSSLCHQGDTYSASYAAVPHLASFCGVETPKKINENILHLIVCIEVARQTGRGHLLPEDIKRSYLDEINRLPRTLAELHSKEPSEELAIIAAAAFALVANKGKLAEAYLEMHANIAEDFLSWALDL